MVNKRSKFLCGSEKGLLSVPQAFPYFFFFSLIAWLHAIGAVTLVHMRMIWVS